jgi:hypothetical protein
MDRVLFPDFPDVHAYALRLRRSNASASAPVAPSKA